MLRAYLLVAALGTGSALAQASRVPRVSTGCRVTAQVDRIEFVFPPADRKSWRLHPRGDPWRTTAEYWWEVGWPAPGAPIIERRSVGMIHEIDTTRAGRSISLAELLANSADISLSDRSIFQDEVGILSVPDSAISASVNRNRVVLAIIREAAMARFLKPYPDSVTFTFAEFGDTLEICRAAMPKP